MVKEIVLGPGDLLLYREHEATGVLIERLVTGCRLSRVIRWKYALRSPPKTGDRHMLSMRWVDENRIVESVKNGNLGYISARRLSEIQEPRVL